MSLLHNVEVAQFRIKSMKRMSLGCPILSKYNGNGSFDISSFQEVLKVQITVEKMKIEHIKKNEVIDVTQIQTTIEVDDSQKKHPINLC